jgi:hypothetical protein
MVTEEKIKQLYETMSEEEKTVYCYNKDDENIYTEKKIAFYNPIASIKSGKVVLMKPANSTFEKPMEEKKSYVCLFNNNKWEQIEDCKGKFYYDVDSDSLEEYKKHKNVDKIFLTEEEKQEVYSGKSIKLVNGKYEFYFTDETLKEKIISKAISYLNSTDFYFYGDYPTEKVPERMSEYREYLRSLNSEKNLKNKDIQNIIVKTYEDFIVD